MNNGFLDVLNIGAGHLTFRFAREDADEVAKAKKVITDMLRRGYMIFVKVGGEQKRVREFDEAHEEYILEEPDELPELPPRRAPEGIGVVRSRSGTREEETRPPARPTRRIAAGTSDRHRSDGGGLTMSKLQSAIGNVLGRSLSQIVAVGSTEPTWKDVRKFADKAAIAKGEWGGAPIPVDHVRLVMEPRYPFKGMHGAQLGQKDQAEPETPDDYVVTNSWFSYAHGTYIYVCRDADGVHRAYRVGEGAGRRLTFWFNTLGVASQHAWDIQVENRAVEKLRDLLTPHALHCYQLTGTFLETSRRSRVTYLFRKLRPTIAMRPNAAGNMEAIAVLCMHPLGYYAETWAGVMCPTDDVVAHLMLMRGDEHRFWKKANHHQMHWASAGI